MSCGPNHWQTNINPCIHCDSEKLSVLLKEMESIKAILAELLYTKVEQEEKKNE